MNNKQENKLLNKASIDEREFPRNDPSKSVLLVNVNISRISSLTFMLVLCLLLFSSFLIEVIANICEIEF